MSEYTQRVEIMECDYYYQLPPKQLLEHCLSFTLLDMRQDGCGPEAILEQLDAVWMISHMRYTQTAPIFHDDLLTYRCFPRTTERGRYRQHVDILRAGEKLVDFDTAYIPVHREARHILRLNQLAPLWTVPVPENEAPPLISIRPDCDFVPCGSDTVRLSDCDKNHHMTSGAYLSMACNALDYWSGDDSRFMRCMQVDFSSEARPGTQLQFFRGRQGFLHYVRGVKPDGKVAFTAACDF